jgi:hypothetical protein
MKKIILMCWLLLSCLFPAFAGADECLEGDCDNGTGTGFTNEGKIYRGEWRDGLPHGFGRLTLGKDKFIEGRWEKGELVEEKKNELRQYLFWTPAPFTRRLPP